MSRNSPMGHPGVRAPVRRPLPDDPFTAPPTGQGAPSWPPQPAYAPQPGHGQAPSYAAQPPYAQPQPYAAHEGHAQPQAQPYYFPKSAAEPDAASAYAPQPVAHQLPFDNTAQPAPGFPPQLQSAQAAPRWPQQHDPRSYDLGNYMPSAAQGYPPAEPAQFQQALDPAPHHHPGLDPGEMARPGDARFAAPQHGYGESDADFDEMLAEDEEEPRRGRRGMMIAAALVGAIGLGGALAYTYKTFVASGGGPAPVIKAADFGPNKVKPVVQDGKAFANTDKKLLNRLGEDGSAPNSIGVAPPPAPEAADERTSDDPNAPRKVKIIPITPAPQAGAAPVTTPPRSANPAPLITVPGVTLEPMVPPQAQTPPSAARVMLPPPQPQAKAAQQPPVAKAEPPPAAESQAPVKKAAPVAVKTPVPKTKTAAVAPAAPAAAASGYVAVLSSKKSRMDALKAFADMRDKYGDVLASKTPDVQEVNLGDKGVWYRAVVGPPGSREAAVGLCTQLKTAGYANCWVTAY